MPRRKIWSIFWERCRLRTAVVVLLGGVMTVTAVLAQQRSFVACPIVRDTRTVPCYLAEYDGETYFLGIQQDITSDFHPPQLKHEALVEGTIASGPRVCGGIPLRPVAVSVMKEVNLGCDMLLPAENGIDAPLAQRGAGPSTEPLETAAPVRRLSGRQEFTVLYSFNDDVPDFQAQRAVGEAAAYAKEIRAAGVKVSGYRATSLLSNGQWLIEKVGLAEKRAQSVATLLRGLGVANVSVEWKADAEPGDGKGDPSRRRVEIVATP
jgi:outer membrane protein OmpA-like peptidoglycan-associated protein